MDELMQKLSGYLDAAEGVITEYAPQAVDAALFVVRAQAIWHLVAGLIAVAVLGVMARVFLKQAKLAAERGVLHNDANVLACIGSGAVIVPAAIVALMLLGDFYNWIAALDPMLGLVYKAVSSAGLL